MTNDSPLNVSHNRTGRRETTVHAAPAGAKSTTFKTN